MKVVKIKMNRTFTISFGGYRCYNKLFEEGTIYFAIDGGDYWLVQCEQGYDFSWVIPKEIKPETPGAVAEVVAE